MIIFFIIIIKLIFYILIYNVYVPVKNGLAPNICNTVFINKFLILYIKFDV